MGVIDRIAEKKIQEALRRGDLDGLPGAGKPLALDDIRLIPEELRAAYRLLRNSGYLPPELADRREIADIEALLPSLVDGEKRNIALRRLSLLRTRIKSSTALLEQAYQQRLVRAFSLGADS